MSCDDNSTRPASRMSRALRTFRQAFVREMVLPHLEPGSRFFEPCAGEGRLIEHLVNAGHICVGRCDLLTDARTWRYLSIESGVIFITNPPWSRPALHNIIVNLSNQAPAWLLLDSDWAHKRQSIPYLPRLQKIVSVGRLKWIEGSPHTSKDNAAWMLFALPRPDERAVTHFIGRTDSMRRAA
jgi:hypothetical protein